jgi:hypothetical protein
MSSFARGKCTRDPCPYSHASAPEQKNGAQKNQAGAARGPTNDHPAPRCHKCDSTQHSSRECKFNGECTWCGRMGHKEQVCSHKKAGRTQAHLAHADGDDIQANMLTVKEKNHKRATNNITMSTRKGKGKRTFKLANPTISMSIGEEKSTRAKELTNNITMPPVKEKITTPANASITMPSLTMSTPISSPPNGMVREVFLADTGSTRSMHPHGRSAVEYSHVSLNISTACVGKTMRSEGVGKMQVYTPQGLSVPGFESVVFSKQCARKLASVGELCDAGLVCVFDKNGLTTYQEKNVKVEGEFFTKDMRDKNKLYPLSLLRKVEDKNVAIFIPASAPSSTKEEKKNKKVCIGVQETSEIFSLAPGFVVDKILALHPCLAPAVEAIPFAEPKKKKKNPAPQDLLPLSCLEKFSQDKKPNSEIFSLAHGIVVDKILPLHLWPSPVVDAAPLAEEKIPVEEALSGDTPRPPPSRLQQCSQDKKQTSEICSLAPGLVVDTPIIPPHSALQEKSVYDAALEEKIPAKQELFPLQPRVQNFSQDKKSEVKPANFGKCDGLSPTQKLSNKKIVDFHKLLSNKKIVIAPLRQAKLSPCWEFSKKSSQTEFVGNLENGTVVLKSVPSEENILPRKRVLNKPEDSQIFLQGNGTVGKEKAVCNLQRSIYAANLNSCPRWIGNCNWKFIVSKIVVSRPWLPFFIFSLQENVVCVCSTHAEDIFVLFNTPKKFFRDALFDSVSGIFFLKILDQCRGPSRPQFFEIDSPDFQKTPRNKTPGSIWPNKPRGNSPLSRALLSTSPKYFPPPLIGLIKNSNKNVNLSLGQNFGGLPKDRALPSSILFIAVPSWSIAQHKDCVKDSKEIQENLPPTLSLEIIFSRQLFLLTLSECADANLSSEDGAKAPLCCPFLFPGNSVTWAPQNLTWTMTSPTQAQCVFNVVGPGEIPPEYASMYLQPSNRFIESFLSKKRVDCRDSVMETPTSKSTSTSKTVVTHLVFSVPVGDSRSYPNTRKGRGCPQSQAGVSC